MSFLGKEYKLEKQENMEAFLRSAGFPEDAIAKAGSVKLSYKLVLDGDTYTYFNTIGSDVKKTSFKSGVEFDDVQAVPVKITYTVEGNVVTQVVKSEKGSATLKWEYNGDEVLVTITGSNFDGVAKQWCRA